MNLHLQGPEPGLGELGLKRCLLQLAGAETPIVEESVHRDNDEQGNNQIDVEAEPEIRAVAVEERRELLAQARGGRPKDKKMKRPGEDRRTITRLENEVAGYGFAAAGTRSETAG